MALSHITADDAVRLTAELAHWLDQPQAHRALDALAWAHIMPDSATPARETAALAARILSQHLREEPPIWCNSEMVDLLAVAGTQVPPEQLATPLRLSEGGIVVLAKPLPLEWQRARDESGNEARATTSIQAISWVPTEPTGYIVQAWNARGPLTSRLPDNTLARFPCLVPVGGIEAVWQDVDDWSDYPMLCVLHALAGLIRTPTTVEDDTSPSTNAARHAQRKGTTSAGVRRIYLRRPESGPAELQALRDERRGHPRGHWVRGHWRRQWHSSVEEHRWVWIEGHPRGDWSKGQVEGDKVLIARS